MVATQPPGFMGLPGGAIVPVTDPPRRDGPADAPAVVVVVEDREPSTAASDGAGYLDGDAFVGQARADALRAATRRPKALIGGERYELPWDDAPTLMEFVATLYLVHGWRGVHDVRDQLQQMVDAKRVDVGLHRQRPPVPPVPPARQAAVREQVAGADLTETQRWGFAYQNACQALAAAVLQLAARLEEQARTIMNAMLERSQERVIDENVGYFQWKDRAAAIAALGVLHSDTLVPGNGLDDLRARMGRLRPLAAALKQSRKRAHEEEQRLERLLGRDKVGTHSPASLADLSALRRAADAREAAFSAAVLAEAPLRPVLFRLDLETLSRDPADRTLGELVFARLQRTWKATERLAARFARARPARDADRRRIHDGAVPEALIAEASKGSVWAFPKVVQAAATQMPPEEKLLIDRMLKELDAETAQHGRAELRAGALSGLGLGALTLALIAVCPPAGIALDVALSAPEVFSATEDYQKAGDEALSDLDPRASLSDAEPSVVPIVIAVAATLMSAA